MNADKKPVKYQALFSPIKIGKVEIKNHIAMAPITHNGAEPGGFVGQKMISFFTARAKGGAGLIFSSPCVGKSHPSRLNAHPYGNAYLYTNEHKRGWSDLAEAVHAFDAKIFVQVGPAGGSEGRLAAFLGDPEPMACSPVPFYVAPETLPEKRKKMWRKRGYDMAEFYKVGKKFAMPTEIPVDMIRNMENEFANTTQMVKECGFDGAELHFAHGIVTADFLSPRTNFRTDEYGGSLKKRVTFLRNSLEKTRERVGPDFALGFRITAAEHLPGGQTAEETAEMCALVEDLVDFVDLSCGVHHENFTYMSPEEDGLVLADSEIIAKKLKVPVLAPSVHNPDLANRAISEGKADMIALGRQLIADPEWANKVAEGKPYVKCLRCDLGCWRRFDLLLPIRCEVNPNVLLEYQMPEYQWVNAPYKGKKSYYMGEKQL